MEEYTLCSSSTEQGEIPIIHVKRFKEGPPPFPRTKSQLQYMYLPNSSLFVGPNTVPRSCDYQTSVLTTKLKRRLKLDLPHPFLCLPMTPDRAFFENRLVLVSETCPAETVDLHPVRSIEKIAYIGDEVSPKPTIRKETRFEHVKDKQDDTYKDVCQELLSEKLLQPSEVRDVNIVIRDSMISSLLAKDAYTRFSVKKKGDSLYVCFEDVYIREIKYYDYLSRYGEEVIRSLKSSEVRISSGPASTVVVYSSALFRSSAGVQRLFSGIDVEKSIETVVNIEDVAVVASSGALGKELKALAGISFEEGEYIFNDRKVYIVDPAGQKLSFVGVVFTDFMDAQELAST